MNPQHPEFLPFASFKPNQGESSLRSGPVIRRHPIFSRPNSTNLEQSRPISSDFLLVGILRTNPTAHRTIPAATWRTSIPGGSPEGYGGLRRATEGYGGLRRVMARSQVGIKDRMAQRLRASLRLSQIARKMASISVRLPLAVLLRSSFSLTRVSHFGFRPSFGPRPSGFGFGDRFGLGSGVARLGLRTSPPCTHPGPSVTVSINQI